MADIIQFENVNSKGFGCIPKMVMQDTRLGLQAKGIYAFLASYAGAGKAAFPCLKTILYYLGIGQDTYYKYLKQLIEYGYIRAEKQRNERGNFWRTVYTLCSDISPHEEISQVDNKTDNASHEEASPKPHHDSPLMEKPKTVKPFAEKPFEVQPLAVNQGTYNKHNIQETDYVINQSINHHVQNKKFSKLKDRFEEQVELDYFIKEKPEIVPTVKLLIQTMCEQYETHSDLIDQVNSCTIMEFIDELKEIDFSRVRNKPRYTQSVFMNYLMSESLDLLKFT